LYELIQSKYNKKVSFDGSYLSIDYVEKEITSGNNYEDK